MNCDIAIIGAGIFGMTAAIELRKRGYSVILIEQGKIPHPQAASTDISKIIRIEYGDDDQYMEMAEASILEWRKWNREFGIDLFHEVGVIMMCSANMSSGEFEYESFHRLTSKTHRVTRLDTNYIHTHFPAWRQSDFKDGYYNAFGGYAESGKVLIKLKGKAMKLGIQILEDHQVTSINHNQKGILVIEINRLISKIKYEKILLSTGSWTTSLMPETQSFLKSTGHPVFHLKPKFSKEFSPDVFPVFTADISKTGWYGFPIHPFEGVVKIANHGIGRILDPYHDAREVLYEQELELRSFLSTKLPSLYDAEIVYQRLCLYADTLDDHFWIDEHPEIDDLFLATGGSGHGFKFAPILGPLIADVVEKQKNDWSEKFRWRKLHPDTHGEEAARHRNHFDSP